MAALITPVAYWAIGIPVAGAMCFRADLGLKGIWIGPTLAVFFNTLMYNVLIIRTEWEKIIKEVAERRRTDKGITDDNSAKNDKQPEVEGKV